MAIYTVFHFQPLDTWPRSEVLIHHFPMGYLKVAEVECDHPEEAYRLTNHIDVIPWQQNKGVKPFCEKARSTSPGDIIVTPTGDKLFVAWIGMWPLSQRWWWPFTLEGSKGNRRVTTGALLTDWLAYHGHRLWTTLKVDEPISFWTRLALRCVSQIESGKQQFGPLDITWQRWLIGEHDPVLRRWAPQEYEAFSIKLNIGNQEATGAAYWGRDVQPGRFASHAWRGQCGIWRNVSPLGSPKPQPAHPPSEMQIFVNIGQWTWRIK